jgi:hypothetical protein
MSNLRRSARLASKQGNVPSTIKQEGVPLTVKVAKPKVKNIDLGEVTVSKPPPKLVDYDSDDSERTISDIVTLPVKPVQKVQPVQPVEAVKPVESAKKVEVKTETVSEIKKEPVVKDIPMPALEPFEEFKQGYVPSFVFDKNTVHNCALCQLSKKIVPTVPTMNNPKPNLCSCGICSTVSNKADSIIREIKNYLNRLEAVTGSFGKIAQSIQLFEYIDKNLEYMHSREFCKNANSSKLLETIHKKSLTLQDEINGVVKTRSTQGTLYINDRNMCETCLKLLNKVHTKCHLYGLFKIDKTFLLEDEIYNKFINTYMNDFLSKA